MKRDRDGFRVFCFAVVVLLFACLAVSRSAILAAAQSPSDDNQQKAKKPKDDVTKDTPGQVIKPGRELKMDVDLALVNVTVTDPYNRLVTGWTRRTFESLRTTWSRKS